VIGSRSQRRWLNLGGVAAVAGLMGYALFAQHVLGLEACPLCIFQRGALISVGVVLLIAGLHSPRGLAARGYAFLGTLAAVIGAGISSWHVYIQNLPEDEVPACGPGLSYMIEAFSTSEVLRMVFTGSGECHEINWIFLGLSMPAWVLIWFVILGSLSIAANWTRLTR
jgi:disulfide bond formation protein DsbB